jgi:hypothetical protein
MHRVTVVCLGLAAVLLVVSTSVQRAQSASNSAVVSKCGSLGVKRPKAIVFACADAGLRAHKLHWPKWGGRIAIGHGVQEANDCDPSCVAGHFHTTSVTVHLDKRRSCPGRSHRYYRRATLIPASGPRSAWPLTCPD